MVHPHQLTLIDLVALLFEYLLLVSSGGGNAVAYEGRTPFKIPLGTLLPYFDEDSKHAYAIVPGFYKAGEEGTATFVQRTASDVLQLIEDIVALFNKYLAKYRANPDVAALLQELLADPDYQAIVAELEVYATLSYGEQFKNMYHPLICALKKTLYRDGVPVLMRRETQLQSTALDFVNYYDPNKAIVPKTYVVENAGVRSLSYPVEDLDFSYAGAYSGLQLGAVLPRPAAHREPPAHQPAVRGGARLAPLHLRPDEWRPDERRSRLAPAAVLDHEAVLRDDDARVPEAADRRAPPRSRERRRRAGSSRCGSGGSIRSLRTSSHGCAPSPTRRTLWASTSRRWSSGPTTCSPRTRWSPSTRRPQLYVLAASVLGPRPQVVTRTHPIPVTTWYELEADGIDELGNALVALENLLPDHPPGAPLER